MSRRKVWGPMAALVVGTVCGCGGGASAQSRAYDPDLLRAVARMGAGDEVTRSQKPDAPPAPPAPPAPVILPVSAPSDVAGARAVARVVASVNGIAILEEEVRAGCFQELAYTAQLPETER